MKKIRIYTDGACLGNPGPGGIGVVLVHDHLRKEISRGFRCTTNNRMELLAAITALEALKTECRVELTSDSKYLVDAVRKRWLDRWRRNGWRRSDRKPVLNADLWQRLIPFLEMHKVEFVWIKGHAGHAENERCDALAMAAARSMNLEADEGYESA